MNTTVSIVILTYNRPLILESLLSDLEKISSSFLEVVVVDNNSEQDVAPITARHDFVRLVSLPENIGIGGRNRGIEAASGDIIVTLDDDVGGITSEEIDRIREILAKDDVAGVCFKVIDAETHEIIDWGHHRKQEEYSEVCFVTDDISEGAVAFRRDLVLRAGLYPEEYFISHEGPDLAIRLMNLGYRILYSPDITVLHSHSTLGRTSWRRYYYDSRNLIWLVVRHYHFFSGCKTLLLGMSAMAVYALRDGYFYYWLLAVRDAIKGIKWALDSRVPMSRHTLNILDEIKPFRPGLLYLIKKRLFRSKLGI